MEISNTTVVENIRDVFQTVWNFYFDQVCFENDLVVNFLGMFVFPSLLIHWIIGSIVTYFDYTKKPDIWINNKTQNVDKNEVSKIV